MAELTSYQFSEWMAYEEIEPFGTEWSETMVGLICSTVANFSTMMVDEAGKRKLWTPRDFILRTTGEQEKVEPKKKQTVEEMKSVLQTIASVANRGQQKKLNPRKKRKANGS